MRGPVDERRTHDEETDAARRELTPEELEAQEGESLPDRTMMSLIEPGVTGETPAAALLPDEASQWHGPPGEPHIM
jgi:hypothetical protein